MGGRRFVRVVVLVARVAAGAVAIGRLAQAARASRPVSADATEARRPGSDASSPAISVVIPARDEAMRIGPLLQRIVGAPGVAEVIVVDDESSDGTATIAGQAGATVVRGTTPPPGWAGKTWALQQGIESATTEWVVTLDADTRPDPRLPTAIVSRMQTDRLDLLSVGGRFECPTAPTRWLHAAMLTTLVYRFGPPGTATPAHRSMANGQCTAFRRDELLAAGGLAPVAGEVVEDVALARRLATDGRAVGFLDASDLLTVRMFESLGDTWRGWGRSLALPGVEPTGRQVADLGLVLAAQALPIPRLLLGRGDVVDVVLALARLGTLAGTRTAYDRRDGAYWLSPMADVPAAIAIARGILRGGRQTWRGRVYG